MSHSRDIPNLVGHILDHGRLKLTRVLGSGSNGVIYHAVDLISGSSPTEYAVKCLIRATKDTPRYNLQRQEIAFHKLLSHHPNVVTLHNVLEHKYYLFLVMDFCSEGDFFTYLSKRKQYRGDDRLVRDMLLQILSALEACHAAGISHRDIKPENILVSDTSEGTRLLLTDFGLATKNRASTSFGAGSSLYMSPECIGEDYICRTAYDTRANDIWALGVILLTMITGHNPWNTASWSDPCYVAYRRNPNFLRDMLPISESANYILFAIFRRERDGRVTLPALRHAVRTADTFFMGPMDIIHGSAYLRDVARSYHMGAPYQAYYTPWACDGLQEDAQLMMGMDERQSGVAEYAEDRKAASASSQSSKSLETDGPDTPELRSQQLDASQLINSLYVPPSLHPVHPAGNKQEDVSWVRSTVLRRFMDRFA